MPLNLVTLTLDVYDGTGHPVQAGTAFLVASSVLTDTTDHQIVWQYPIAVSLQPPAGASPSWLPTVSVYATDNAAISPGGWAWTISFQAPGGPAPFSFFLPHSAGASQYLSAQVPVLASQSFSPYLPLPSGTAVDGYVPVATGSGSSSGWFPGPGLAPSGGNDAANVQALINLGVRDIRLQAGTFTASTTVTSSAPPTYIRGAGVGATIWNYTGSGDAFRLYSTAIYTSGYGGGILGVTVDGSGASAGACGIHAGDIYQLEWDCEARFFRGANSKGIWFDNQYFWCEDMYGHLSARQNTSNVVFDMSANISGQVATSYARTLLDIVLDCKGVGDGVTLQNGAELYDSRIGIYGNMDNGAAQHYALNINGQQPYSFTATNASPCVFTAAGSYYSNGMIVTLSGGSLPAGFTAGTAYFVVSASGATFELAATFGGSPINSTSTGSGTAQGPFSRIYASRLDIGMEVNGTSGAFPPVTINFNTSGANAIRDCTGIIDFTGSAAFASAVNGIGSMDFDGPVLGDVSLMRVIGAGAAHFSAGAIGNNAFLTTRYNQFVLAFPASNVTGAILGSNDLGAQGANAASFANRTVTVVNSGTGSITFDVPGTSHVSTGTSCVIAAGMAMTFAWTGTGLWYPVT